MLIENYALYNTGEVQTPYAGKMAHSHISVALYGSYFPNKWMFKENQCLGLPFTGPLNLIYWSSWKG